MIANTEATSLVSLLRGAAIPTIVDAYDRAFTYLRISVTDQCNLRCVYCMPEEGVAWLPREEILRFEEIVSVVEAAASCGVNKIRITGGEPLVRKGLSALIAMIANVQGITDLSMTTNGTMLAEHIEKLKTAGLQRVNISLDTLDPEKFRRIARRGELRDVLNGIAAAESLNLHPVKLNMVVLKGVNDDEIEAFASLTNTHRVQVRFIEVMPVGEIRDCSANSNSDAHVTGTEVRARIEKRYGRLLPACKSGRSSDPAQLWKIPGSTGMLGFVDAMSNAFCARCNRLRLTADGKLRSCLLQGGEVDVRSVVRSEVGSKLRHRLIAAFRNAAYEKPEYYALGSGFAPGTMNRIGG